MPLLANSPTLPEVGVSPSTPASGGLVLFAKSSDSKLYYKNDQGVEFGPLDGLASNVVTSATSTANKLTVSASTSAPSSPSVNDLWVVNDLSSTNLGSSTLVGEIDHAERNTSFLLTGLTSTYIDVEGLQIDVPATTQPYMLDFMSTVSTFTGTSAAGANVIIMFKIIDTTNSLTWAYVPVTAVQVVSGASFQYQVNAVMARRILPHTTARTYKVQVRTAAAAFPANWGASSLLVDDSPTSGLYPPAYLRAEYV